jgi:hypothetical protein
MLDRDIRLASRLSKARGPVLSGVTARAERVRGTDVEAEVKFVNFLNQSDLSFLARR